jgi:hypothetical protein
MPRHFEARERARVVLPLPGTPVIPILIVIQIPWSKTVYFPNSK